MRTLGLYAVLVCVPLAVLGQARSHLAPLVDARHPAPGLRLPGLLANDAAKGPENSRRVAAMMHSLVAGGAIHIPAGTYYFRGSALPNRGTIETTRPGQAIYGDGPGVTRLVQMDTRQDFGFVSELGRKRVPCATVRLRHKGCSLRGLTVMLAPSSPPERVVHSAAIQVAHIRYRPDHQIGIVETTGQGIDFLVDHVTIDSVDVGENLDAGILSRRFFEVGIDIVGSGGHVRASRMHRLDARIGIRLDNGNHCPQGEYEFDNIHQIGEQRVTDGGVFFDWIGGQAPRIRDCSSSFISGMHAGPLGADGDRLEPTPEGEVVRRPDKRWDWLTWHAHTLGDSPNAAERASFYGLPRQAHVVRIGSSPRTGGTEWREGVDFAVQTASGPGDPAGATRIEWRTAGPAPGSVYYVVFREPVAYRVHDLEWGNLLDFSCQEAAQSGSTAFAVLFEDSGFGELNPDFHFGVGYGFEISHAFILDGDVRFEGRVDHVNLNNSTAGVCRLRMAGATQSRQLSSVCVSGSSFNDVLIGDLVSKVSLDRCEIQGKVSLAAAHAASDIQVTGNQVLSGLDVAIEVRGQMIRNVRIQDNTVRGPGGDGISVTGVSGGFVMRNQVSDCRNRGIAMASCEGLVVADNLVFDNRQGISVRAEAAGAPTIVRGNVCRNNREEGMVVLTPSANVRSSIAVTDNMLIGNGQNHLIDRTVATPTEQP